jgi:hypothetical protein
MAAVSNWRIRGVFRLMAVLSKDRTVPLIHYQHHREDGQKYINKAKNKMSVRPKRS